MAAGWVVSLVLTAAVAAVPPPGTSDPPQRWSLGATASESHVTIGGGWAGAASAPVRTRSPLPASAPGPVYVTQRRATTYCGNLDAVPTGAPCVDDAESGTWVRTCEDGSIALDPLYRAEVDPVSGALIGSWERVDGGGCAEDPEPPQPEVVLSAEEFQRLPLAASPPRYQPADGRGLVGMDLVVYTDAAPQSLTTEVLGVPVAVRATPVSFAWDFGDGSVPVVTTEPGAPWPDHTVGHPYAAAGEYEVRLTTTWRGEYRAGDAGPWLAVAGTATTSSAPFVATVETAPARLVADP